MKKQALLIGINNYSKAGSLGNLNYARQDAEAVGDALKKYYGFTDDEITLMTCQQEGTLSPAAPISISSKLSPEQFPEPVDLFIFGFWGHGIWENNVRYLCPMVTYENDLSKSCLSVEEVKQCIYKLPIRNACFLFDCCQSIAGRGAAQYMPEEEMASLQNMGRDIVLKGKKTTPNPDSTFYRNVAILNACRPGEIAYEWDNRKHGIFTAHLLDAMKQRLTTVNDWASHLANKVNQTAKLLGKKSQTPFYSLEGCIELPVYEGALDDEPDLDNEIPDVIFEESKPKPQSEPEPAPNNHPLMDEKMKQAALKLVELFQDSSRLYENDNIKRWFLRQKDEVLSVYVALDNHSITGQVAYSRLIEIARNAGNWINANRVSLGGKSFVSYLWYSWVEFTKENHLEDLLNALNP